MYQQQSLPMRSHPLCALCVSHSKVQCPTHFAKIRRFPEKTILTLHLETKSNRSPPLPASGPTFLVVARGKPTFIGPHRAASGGRRTRYTRFLQEIRKENNHMLPQPRLSGHLRTGGQPPPPLYGMEASSLPHIVLSKPMASPSIQRTARQPRHQLIIDH